MIVIVIVNVVHVKYKVAGAASFTDRLTQAGSTVKNGKKIFIATNRPVS